MAEHFSDKKESEVFNLDNSRPLFEAFDHRQEGGLLVDPDSGDIYEVSHKMWKIPEEGRVKKLPYILENNENGVSQILYVGDTSEIDSETVTAGLEVELGMHHDGEKFYVSKEAGKYIGPDGEEIDFGDIGVDPEAYQVMIELKTEMARGLGDLSQKAIELKARFVMICQEKGVYPDFLSAYPGSLSYDELIDHPYARETAFDNMPKLDELFVCTSEQLNIGWASPEAGRHALSMYQQYAPIMSLVTGAAPIYKDKIGVTVEDMLGVGTDKEMTNNMTGEPLLGQDDYLRKYAQQEIFDVREFQRILGSTGGGTWDRPSPISNASFLMEADKLLRSGESLSMERTLGAHRERVRKDHIEICSLSGAGGNTHIVKATHELVIAYLAKQQKNFQQATEVAGEGVNPDEVLLNQRELAVSTSHANNVFAAISGKESGHQISHNGQEKVVRPAELLKNMIAEAGGIHGVEGNDGSEGISVESACELYARLQEAPKAEEFKDPTKSAKENIQSVFDDFFKRYGTMTATEAFHIAHEVEPDMSTSDMVELFSKKAQKHILDTYRDTQDTMQ